MFHDPGVTPDLDDGVLEQIAGVTGIPVSAQGWCCADDNCELHEKLVQWNDVWPYGRWGNVSIEKFVGNPHHVYRVLLFDGAGDLYMWRAVVVNPMADVE